MTAELFIAGLLVAVWATPSTFPPDELRAYVVDVARSRIWVVTHRTGLLSFLGHEHAIVPEEWSAELCLDHPVPRGARGVIEIRTGSLVVDTDSARALAGLGRGPGQADVRKIQRKMLDEGHLDAQHHPQIRLDLMAAGPVTDGAVRARVRLDLHGVTRELELPVRVDALDDRALRFSGEMRVRQRDFGIEPESIAGVVKVKDEVDLHFDLVATRTTRSCARGEP